MIEPPAIMVDTRTALYTVIVATVLLLVLSPKKTPTHRPPTVKQYPIVGSFFRYIGWLAKMHLPYYLLELHKEMGPILVADMFGRDSVVVADPTAAKRILSSSTEFKRDDYLLKNSMDLFEYPLFGMATGETWKAHRKLIQTGMGPQFVRKAFTATLEVMEHLCRIFDEKIQNSSADEITVDIREYLSYSTLDIIMATSFSIKMDSLANFVKAEESKTVVNNLGSLRSNIDQLSGLLVYRLMVPPILHWFIGAAPSQVVNVKKYFKELVDSFVNPRKEGITNEEGDLLDILLTKDEGGNYKLTDSELRDETLSILLAGHETTANALTNVFLALCFNPQVLSRVLDEIDALLPTITSELSFDDVPKFKYLDKVFRETMRHYPVVFAVDRLAKTDVELMGYKFEKGTIFTVHFNGIHQSKEFWGDDVAEFNPDRFDREGNHDANWFPFSAGLHICPGMKMAIMESKVVLIKLLQQFSFELIPGQDLQHVHGVAMHLRNGLKLKFRKRV
ncbi:hypothetical protein HDU79_007438 [Rhizoclosmatium sp. JEL0117]|nr:hypothetical protein HDU79_007438 [Rhizoclosmatium sp. JEL0117]